MANITNRQKWIRDERYHSIISAIVLLPRHKIIGMDIKSAVDKPVSVNRYIRPMLRCIERLLGLTRDTALHPNTLVHQQEE